VKPSSPTRFPQWLSLSTAYLIASAQEYEALVAAGEVKGVVLGDELSAMLALTAAELREEIARRSAELYALGQ
jgi:hypothetical protein